MTVPALPFSEAAALGVIAGLLLLSALLSMAEASIFSLGMARLAEIREKGGRAAGLIDKLLRSPARLIVSASLANDTVNVLAATLIAWTVAARLAAAGGAPGAEATSPFYLASMSTLAAFAAIVVFGQTMPKVLGVAGNEVLARAFAPMLQALWVLTYPAHAILGVLSDRVFGALGDKAENGNGHDLVEGEIRKLVESGSRLGVLDITERELLVNLIRSNEIKAIDVMTPRHEVVGVPVEATADEARRVIKEEDYSRLAVYEGSPENIVGLLTAKDLLRLRLRGDSGLLPRDVMRKPIVAPESRSVADLLNDFRRGRVHFATVVDEFGLVVGIVTLEDVLEEIFGETREDGEESDLENLGEYHWIVLGGMEVRDFNRITGSSLPECLNQTMAGLMLSLLCRRPAPGDKTRAHGFEFEVLEARGIIIHRLRVKRERKP